MKGDTCDRQLLTLGKHHCVRLFGTHTNIQSFPTRISKIELEFEKKRWINWNSIVKENCNGGALQRRNSRGQYRNCRATAGLRVNTFIMKQRIIYYFPRHIPPIHRIAPTRIALKCARAVKDAMNRRWVSGGVGWALLATILKYMIAQGGIWLEKTMRRYIIQQEPKRLRKISSGGGQICQRWYSGSSRSSDFKDVSQWQ